MLEIVFLSVLGSRIKKMVKAKGLKPTKYILILVGLWFGFEISGAVIGFLLFGEDELIYTLLFAFGGAGIGGYLAYRIAQNAVAVPEAPADVLDARMEDIQ